MSVAKPDPEELKMISYLLEMPGGKKRRVITTESARSYARKLGLSLMELEDFALENGIVPLRYERNINSFDIEGQLKLLRSRVSIIGLGGLGGWVAETLARAGVGILQLVDGDFYQESNLNRQSGSQIDNLGENKALATEKRLEKINPGIEIQGIAQFLGDSNAQEIISDSDLVIDALGDIPSRLFLNKYCQKFKKFIVHGAIAGFFGQVALIEPDGSGLEKIYGSLEKAPSSGEEISLGTPSPTPPFIGALQGTMAILFLLGKVEAYRGKLIFFDLREGLPSVISF